ncbi:MAG: TetR/AcrR family transcriptional regulator [Roseibacillus sp.]|jgi:AcrR family transcriptional regulator
MSKPRQRLLETATRLFTERGYECVGINEIIEKAEVAKASFYQHFPSKQDLCAAWLREEAARSEECQRGVLASRTSLRRKLAAQFDDLSCRVSGNCFRGCPFAVTAAMTEAGAESREIIREHTEASRRFWQDLAREAGSSPARTRDLGDAWFLLYTGAFTQVQNAGAAWPIEQARKSAVALLKAA